MRLVAEVGAPGGEAVTSQGVGVQRHLLQGGQGGEEVPGEEAELVTVKEEGPQGGQVTGRERRRWEVIICFSPTNRLNMEKLVKNIIVAGWTVS